MTSTKNQQQPINSGQLLGNGNRCSWFTK